MILSNIIPVIDISAAYQEGKLAQQQIARQIDEACRTWGFFCITGHQIKPEDINQIKTFAKKFFALPQYQKESIAIDENYRGYSNHQREQLDPNYSIDYKEIFDMGYHLEKNHPDVLAKKPFRGPNNHPESLIPGWCTLFENHYQNMTDLARVLFRLIALALKIDEQFFNNMFFESLSTFRVIQYPALPKELGRVVCGAHTDYGLLTILHQDDIGGLQIKNKQDQWIDISPIKNSFVINIGDMMAMWTNDLYKSTQHRVINQGRERISMPFFTEPHPETDIACLPNCATIDRPRKYPNVKCSDWLVKRFKEAYSSK